MLQVPFNRAIAARIQEGAPFRVGMGTEAVTIKRSPNESDAWWCEHQYNTTYTYSHTEANRMYFKVRRNDTSRVTGWYVDTSTFDLVVRIGNDRVEEYRPNEYSILLT